jgi:DNA ligase D-like protein (predicted polymerase)
MSTDDNTVTLEASGHEVRITSPDKVFFPAVNATKLDLAKFYLAVAQPFLAANGGRPSMMERYPDGASGKSFFQKRVPEHAPEWLQTTVVSTPNGTESNALVLADIAHVLWAVNLGCLGFHPWPYLAAASHATNELRIDLDPQPGVTFDMVREAAAHVHTFFDELNMRAYVKTTGSRGLHVYVRLEPRYDSFVVRSAAVALAREMERRHGDLITAQWWKEERGTRVFIDFNQNAPHKTVFGAWAVRPRVGGQVSTPFEWDELPTIDPEALTMALVTARVTDLGNPWHDMNEHPQSLAPLLEYHQRDEAAGLGDAPWPPVYPKMPNEPSRVAPSRAKKPKTAT